MKKSHESKKEKARAQAGVSRIASAPAACSRDHTRSAQMPAAGIRPPHSVTLPICPPTFEKFMVNVVCSIPEGYDW
jgi:hypothetical protein